MADFFSISKGLMTMELKMCDYCCDSFEARTITRVTWRQNNYKNYYCSKCVQPVVKDAMTLPWHKEHGYKIDYPFK